MVMPKYAKLNGMSVHLYVFILTLAVLTASLLYSQQTNALLPLNKVPIIGQPLANTVHGVTDGIVQPTVRSVTNLLPTPIGDTVQTPVNAVTGTLNSIAGPATQPSDQQHPPKAQTQTVSNPRALQVAAPETRLAVSNPKSNEPLHTTGAHYPLLAHSVEPLNDHTPILGASARNFPATKDTSTLIATGVILLSITLLFVSLIGMIIHGHIKHIHTADGRLLFHNDLTRASLIIAGLITIGSVMLFVVLVS